ncbi:MAG: hypothetical protein EOM76_07595 [Sphingobacteriia bacterium]|jgi:hypothetical protein|nr:DUF6175 family protein [Paludibacteraceae bacterium]NCA80030.1 hypothetical protein [Sphingobacteriia bacterium]
MKKNYFVLALLCVSLCAFSQAKKPTIMVVPSDAWCIKNGYVQTFDNQGKTITLPDYKAALQNNTDLLLAISKINEMMTERGFPLKNLESALKTLENQAAEDAMLTSKEGSEVAESPIDKLKKTAKADIWMQLTWSVNQVGPKRSLTFNLQGLDAYTDKQIAGASGTSAPTFSAELPVLLEEAVVAYLDNFNAQLQAHFDDMFANGREITVRIKTWNSMEDGLETDFDGQELSEIIEAWMADNTVQGRFSTTDATENMMYFEQVRIPLFNDKNRAVDARGWVRGLQKHLRDVYQLESKLMMQGLGQAQLVIGEK